MSSVYKNIPFVEGGGGGAVDSFNGRIGAVMSQLGDYTAAQISYNNSGTLIIATNVQNAITELDYEFSQINLANIPGVIDPEKLSSPFYEYKEQVVYTTTGAPNIIYTEDFIEDLVATYTVYVTAVQYAGSAGAYGNTGSFKRTLVVKNIAGIASIRILQWDYQSLEDAAWDLQFSVVTNDLNISVVGVTNQSIKWVCQLTKIITTVI